jgi:integrase
MPARIDDLKPHKRKGHWYLVRRVPLEFAAVDPRGIVYLTTGIRILDDPTGRQARQAVRKLDQELTRFWHDKRAGRDVDAQARFSEARTLSARMGFPYVPAAEAARSLPADDILRRLETLEAHGKVESEAHVAALLGGVAKPVLMCSEMVDEFERICAATLIEKSERQKKKWRTPKQHALDVFLEIIGDDKPLSALTREDTLALRAFWQNRAVAREVAIDTANKNIGRIGAMYQAINDHRQLGLKPLFERLRITGGKDKQRVAFAPELVQTRFLAEGMFDDLNDEARRIVFLVIETGLRLSEACNLSRLTIKLDAPIPHVQVRPDGRQIKTDQSERDIPLVGVALVAMKLQPDGFPRYRDNADALSALVNQALVARKLRPVEGQTLYSLRHTFEDRLTAVEAPEKVVASLMGHKWHRPRYGLGPSLEQKHAWLSKIAFTPPAKV